VSELLIGCVKDCSRHATVSLSGMLLSSSFVGQYGPVLHPEDGSVTVNHGSTPVIKAPTIEQSSVKSALTAETVINGD